MSSFRRLLLAQAQTTPSYTEKEYLQTDGVAYFNTGIVADQNTECEFDFMITQIGAEANFLLGARVAFQNNQFFYRSTGQKGYASYPNTITGINQNIKHKFTATKITSGTQMEMKEIRLDNMAQQDRQVFNVVNFNTVSTILVFACNNGGVVSFKSKPGTRMYNLKIWQSGVLVRDYVARLDNNGVACAYDKVNGTYAYAPVGAFTTN